ncbi:hypothetical protein FRC04_010981 [Tulasnella sp. 424]|nr:hypothetical protein FRC04_010981 [Tulasnella sp. 424]KAG8972143.1 hypothetical protein FRC05_010311 [Tulasnella sp. 425]
MREKAKALSTSRQLFTGLENLRNQKVQWAKEKDELMEKLRALDVDKATPVVPPPSEGVWFARSGKQQQTEEPQSQSASARSTVGLSNPPLPASLRRTFSKWPRIPADPPLSASLRRQHLKWPRIQASPLLKLGPRSTRWLSGAPQDQGTQGLEGSLDEARLIHEIRITPPEPSGADLGSMANATALANDSNQYLSPASCHLLHWRTRRRSRACDNPTLQHPRCIPVMQRTLPPKAPISTSSRRTFNTTFDQPQCIPMMQPTLPPKTPLSASSRRPTSPGSPWIAADPLHRLVSRPSRWFSAAPQVGPSQPDLIDLGAQIVGRDPSSESCARQVRHDRRKWLQLFAIAFGIEDNWSVACLAAVLKVY